MSSNDYILEGIAGISVLSSEEIAWLRKRAWLEQGLLIVHPFDQKLTRHEVIRVRLRVTH